MVKKEFMYCNVEVSSEEELFSLFYDDLFSNGYVKESWLAAVSDREKVFPTGLALENYNVAIPHSDVDHVNESTIAVATLSKPLVFCLMEDPDVKVDVSLVISLIVADPKQQVEFLRSVIGAIQDEQFVQNMLRASSSDEMLNLLKEKIEI